MADTEEGSEGDSTRTVVVAVLMNLAIAVAKTIAAILTGSASMWAEAAHSTADTGNEVLLFIGLRRSARKPDARHPFGYGQERYFWTFLAALGIFLIGGALSIGEGVRSLLVPEPLESLWVGIGVLVVAFGFESYSWHTARKQLRAESRERQRSMVEHLRRASDPSATTVFLEDTAALIGLVLALAALLLHAATGWAGWDAVGSMSIGVLLIVVAYLLARRSKTLLLDESAPSDVLEPIRGQIAGAEWVGTVHDLHAVYVGPGSLLVNAWITPVEAACDAPAADLVRQVAHLRSTLLENPAITQVTVTVAGDSSSARLSGS
ncbi:cation diffusion facilitator family transporter [Pseudosporangium ferrugineum]|uniref:Cation diffusion facilitator family transporter n=1 Tax=Pseudosporangium ferrugineum TaxID=439699 RepID=A0A2T0RG52_9ACTN|nr:cation diffusion facilitator family transporter [Pseudosporangium ferrugineum]PRY20148.1 cation diffusion facilitator family transporter [Pseudosporangium ferrugineum]